MSAPARRTIGVVKVGGSLASDPVRLRTVLADLVDGAEGTVVIVPGGGPFADAVREMQRRHGFSDRLAHRLALDGMACMAAVFSEIEPRVTVARTIGGIGDRAGACVWDPCTVRCGHPDIPENWDVTSDSLALWLATTIGAESCTLVKSADGPAGTTVEEWARLGLVDAAFPHFAKAYAGEIVLRGPKGGAVRWAESRDAAA